MDKKETLLNSNTQTSLEEVTLTEHLSALFDDEVGSFEQRRVLDELKTNDKLTQNLSTYALIGESMRSIKPVAVAGSDFLANIHTQIDSEEEYNEVLLQNQGITKSATNSAAVNDVVSKPNSWLRPVGGFAIAASIAAVAVVGFQNYQSTQSQSPAVIATSMPVDADNMNMLKEQLSLKEMKSAVVVSADKMDVANIDTDVIVDPADGANTVAITFNNNITRTKYQFADARTRSLLKRFVDKHIRHASTSSFVPSVRVIAYADFK